MFIRRQDMIDRFAAQFRDTNEGGLIWQPADKWLPVPVSFEEYETAMAAFERWQMVSMAITWVLLLGGVGYGGYIFMTTDRNLPLALGFGGAFFLSLIVNMIGAEIPVQPFVRRREAMRLAMLEHAEGAGPGDRMPPSF